MNLKIFDEADVPLGDLAAIGLVKNDRLILDRPDMDALLSGRRTDMLRLENLGHAGMKIASLNAKLSLKSGPEGRPELLLHPVYLRSVRPDYLTDTESESLEKGEEVSIEKNIIDHNGQRKRVLIEFDRETNQFLETDEDKLRAPDEINGIPLPPEQKQKFRRGEQVEVEDGTKLQYTATNRDGIRANRIGLIASVLLDGGISYLLFHGLRTLRNYSSDFQEIPLGDAYMDTLSKMQDQQQENDFGLSMPHGQHTRGYHRTGSR
jgi:hypothetical protein